MTNDYVAIEVNSALFVKLSGIVSIEKASYHAILMIIIGRLSISHGWTDNRTWMNIEFICQEVNLLVSNLTRII